MTSYPRFTIRQRMRLHFVRMRTSAKAKWLLASTAILLFAAFSPTASTAAAAYEVIVCDATGRVIPGIVVHRYVQDYSTGRDAEHSEDRVTDTSGKASFPKLTHRVSIMGALFGCARQFLASGAHASCGTYSDIAVSNGSWIEVARADIRASSSQRKLRITLSPCPSGDWMTCRRI